jgi:pyruvate dehydrogenase E2 component (dihydrolipoamide acetyltransferase)/2-oxoisovalerate dehydrogenase E2 component (dihydrolipoyl transacylase)
MTLGEALPEGAMDFQVPELGEGVYEAELVSWLVKPGERVKRGQTLMEVLTDKATMEVPSPFEGTITELRAEPGQPVKVGDVVLSYRGGTPGKALAEPDGAHRPATRTSRKGAGEAKSPAPASAPVSAKSTGNGPSVRGLGPAKPVKAAPSVRYMARKLGIDLGQLRGSGPEGRVLIEDLSSALQVAAPQPGASSPAAQPEARPDYGRPGMRLKVQGLRRKIAEHMVLAKRTIPHYSYVDECDVTELVQLRQGMRDHVATSGLKLTYLPFFVKAAARALREIPLVNSSLDETVGEIVLHDHYHIGIAVATPAGLIVPVIKDADRKDLIEIAHEADRLSTAARAGKARLEDLRGGTFTITSIGGVGGLISTPVINHPETAILGIGKIVKRPVYDAAGMLRPADLVYLSFSFDHRVIDGAVGAAFGNALIRELAHPVVLLLPEKGQTSV